MRSCLKKQWFWKLFEMVIYNGAKVAGATAVLSMWRNSPSLNQLTGANDWISNRWPLSR